MTKNRDTEGNGEKSKPAPNWGREELRYVLETASTRSFNKAAAQLGVSTATVIARITSLEQRVGYKMFDRSPRGAFLTVRGQRLITEARRAYLALEKLEYMASNIEAPAIAHVRLSITDGIATFWIGPRVSEFHAERPDIALECNIGEAPGDPFLAQTDISLRLKRPETEEFVVRELGYMHFIPYASKSYIARNGAPKSREELAHHSIVEHTSYRQERGPWFTWDHRSHLSGPAVLRTNIGALTVTAIEGGAGIGLLPTYVSYISDELVALDLDVHMRSEMFLCYLRDVGDGASKKVVSDWLQAIFNPQLYPCFSEEFISPKDFPRSLRGRRLRRS